MIMNTPPVVIHAAGWARPLCPLALLALWCGFALSGASAAEEPSDEQAQTKPQCQKKVVVVVKEPGEDVEVQIQTLLKEALAGVNTGSDARVLVRRIGGEGLDDKVKLCLKKLHLDAALEGKKFATDHPNADVDGDGKVSRVEHDAFLTALAMRAPLDVIDQFPKADRDENGELEPIEAARLVGGPLMIVRHLARALRPIHEGRDFEVDEDVEVGQVEVRIEAGVDVDRELRIMKVVGDGQAQTIQIRGISPFLADAPTAWLLENVDGEPTTYEVSQYIEVAEQAPAMAILERHPEADLDGDGALSSEEHEFFKQSMFGKAATWIGDGKGLKNLYGDAKLKCGLKLKPEDLEPGTTVEEFIDENGNRVKVVKVVKIQEGRVEVQIEKTVGEPDGN